MKPFLLLPLFLLLAGAAFADPPDSVVCKCTANDPARAVASFWEEYYFLRESIQQLPTADSGKVVPALNALLGWKPDTAAASPDRYRQLRQHFDAVGGNAGDWQKLFPASKPDSVLLRKGAPLPRFDTLKIRLACAAVQAAVAGKNPKSSPPPARLPYLLLGFLFGSLATGAVMWFWQRKKNRPAASNDTPTPATAVAPAEPPSANTTETSDDQNSRSINIKNLPPQEHGSPPQPAIIEPPTQVEKPIEIYTSFPQQKLFYRFQDYFEPYVTHFTISVDPRNPDTGLIRLAENDKPDTMRHAFASRDSLGNVCTPAKVGEPDFTTIRQTPGTVARQPDGTWLLKNKIALDW